MATVNAIVLKHHHKKDGTFNVKIRVTHKTVSVYIPTKYFLSRKQLNKRFEIIDNVAIKAINKDLDKYRDDLIRLGSRMDTMSVREISEYLQREKPVEIDFLVFADKIVKSMKEENRGKTAGSINTTVNSIKKFLGFDYFPINWLNSIWLHDYETWLRREGLNDVSICVYMRNIRSVFNAARNYYNDEDNDNLLIRHYPFRKYKLPRLKETDKRNLEKETIRKIRDYNESKLKLDILGRDVFMISFYLAGTNTADLYLCPSPVKGRLTYNRKKTTNRRKDEALISFAIQPELVPLLEKYKGKNTAFNFCEHYATYADFNKYVNKGLNRIGIALELPKSLTTYYARHSWATLARNKCDVSKDDVNLALNHAEMEEPMKVTDIYLEKDWTRIDNANRKVLDYINKDDQENILSINENR